MDVLLSHSKRKDGCILSSTEICAVDDLHPDASLSSDVAAFYAMVDRPYCKPELTFPRQSLRWSQCSLQHSNTRFNITANGFAKYKRIQTGTQVVFFTTPLEEATIGAGDSFSQANYYEELPPMTRWTIKAVPLLPGTTL